MLNQIKLFAISLFAISMVLNSCTENTTDPNTNPEPKPTAISNLVATSASSSDVLLKFTASPSETNTLFKDYELVVTPGAFAPTTFPKGNNIVQVGGLQEGTEYTFSIVARYTNDSISTPVSIVWSPATRFETNNNDEVIRVYESSSDFGSGLRMFSPNDAAPRTYKVTSGSEWDLGIDTRNSKIVFGSASKIDYNYTGTPQATQIFESFFEADSLNGLFDSQAMNAGSRDSKFSERTFDLTTANPTKNYVFYVRKYEPSQVRYNYAKVMMIKNSSGVGFLQGPSGNRFIAFQISYQKTPDVPYAKVANNANSK